MKHACLAACLLFLATSSAHAAPRNIVVFITDDQGQDAGCYGNRVIRTPHLDALAADGVRFDNAFCTTASCSASRSVILTGMHNHANAQYGHEHSYHHFRAYDDIESLPVMLQRGGYRTARIGKYHVGPEEVFHFQKVLKGAPRNPVQMAESCREFFAAESDKPFFLYFATDDPHRGGGVVQSDPYKPDAFGNKPGGHAGVDEQTYSPDEVIVPPFLPNTPACRAELVQYYQSVSRIDQGLGRLVAILKETGHYDDTLLVTMSDHGIAFPGAKTNLYDPGMRSPFLVRNPYESTRGFVSREMVSWVDVTPTLLAFAGAKPKVDRLQGRSFLPALARSDVAEADEVFASHTFHEIQMYYPMRVVRTRTHKLIWNLAAPLPFPFASDLWASPTWQDRFKQGPETLYGKRTVAAYIQRPKFELYDLVADPDEVRNLADSAEHAETLKSLQTKLRDFQKRTKDPWITKWEYE